MIDDDTDESGEEDERGGVREEGVDAGVARRVSRRTAVLRRAGDGSGDEVTLSPRLRAGVL